MRTRAYRRHKTKVKKQKQHPASLCGKAGCLTCHANKILDIPTVQELRQISKEKGMIYVEED